MFPKEDYIEVFERKTGLVVQISIASTCEICVELWESPSQLLVPRAIAKVCGL